MNLIFACLAGYFIGSIPAGKIFARFGGVDIQKRGSGNIGFANVLRTLGWKFAIPTLIVDVAKGYFATWLGFYLTGDFFWAFAVGYSAVIGHCLPIWLKFHGGKGIATGLGVVLFCAPMAGAIAMCFYGILNFVLKAKSSTASLAGMLAVICVWIFIRPEYWWVCVVLAVTACITLRKNIAGKVPNYG